MLNYRGTLEYRKHDTLCYVSILFPVIPKLSFWFGASILPSRCGVMKTSEHSSQWTETTNVYNYIIPMPMLTHWARNKMAASLQATFSDVIFWVKIFVCRFEFHWRFSQWSNWQWTSTDSDNGLAPNRRQAIMCTNHVLVYWRIYVSLGLNVFIHAEEST